MDNKLQKLVDTYNKTEKEIEKEIGNCDEPEVFKQIFSGHFDELTKTCLMCGGYVGN